MRKVVAFGTGKGFLDKYAVYLKRYSFELVSCAICRNYCDFDQTPVLIVSGDGLSLAEREMLDSYLTAERRLPIIFLNPAAGKIKPGLKNIKERSKYVLPEDLPRKDLLPAVRGCNEIVLLRERLDRLEGELRIKSGELSYILDIGKLLSTSFELPKVLRKIMERMREVVSAEAWAIMLINELDQELVLEAGKGVPGKKVKNYRYKIGEGIAGWAVKDMEPKLISDVSKEKRYDRAFEKASGFKARSIMAVPIVSNNKVLGVIELFNKKDGTGFSREDLDLVIKLLDQTALAIERAT
ncbi:MAG: GAF domain-containing protein, partial [Nitrospirota bacterium]